MLKRILTQLRLVAASLAVMGSMGVPLLQPAIAYGAPVDVLTKCNSDSQVCKGTNSNSLFTLITNVINLLIVIGGIIAVIMIVMGGIRYTTSGGDAGQTKTARDTIVYALVGLIVAIMSFAIVNLVISRL
jgi:hypothetical protein